MHVKADLLSQQLKGDALKPVYLITGEEPLLSQELVDEIRSTARAQGFDERQVFQAERGFDWQSLLEESNALSLFSSKKIVELKLPSGKPGTDGAKKLGAYLDNPPADTVLIIDAGKIDKRTLEGSKWCKAINDSGVICQVWPIKPHEMLRFMKQRASKLKLNIAHDALEVLSSRMEGNLLAAKQELDKLSLLHGDQHITIGTIFDEVKDSARYDAFDLSKSMLSGDSRACVNIIRHLKTESKEIMFVIWAISKDLRTLATLVPLVKRHQNTDSFFRANRIFKQQQTDYLRAANRLTSRQVHNALDLIKRCDDSAKGKPNEPDPWLLMEQGVMAICGIEIEA